MSELEYDVLDELYFVTSFEELQRQTDLDPVVIKDTLTALMARGWVQPVATPGQPAPGHAGVALEQQSFLATKAGLLQHNGFSAPLRPGRGA